MQTWLQSGEAIDRIQQTFPGSPIIPQCIYKRHSARDYDVQRIGSPTEPDISRTAPFRDIRLKRYGLVGTNM